MQTATAPTTAPNTIWVTGYFTVDGQTFKSSPTFDLNDIPDMMRKLRELMANGFTASEPGLEAGEESEVISHLVATKSTNSDGSMTPRIFFYPADDKLKHKWIDWYLDTEDDIKQFQTITGLTVLGLKVFPGKQAPARGEGADDYIISLPHIIRAIRQPNPRHDPNEQDAKKKKPKHLLVRIEHAKPELARSQKWRENYPIDPPTASATPPTEGAKTPVSGDSEQAAGGDSANAGTQAGNGASPFSPKWWETITKDRELVTLAGTQAKLVGVVRGLFNLKTIKHSDAEKDVRQIVSATLREQSAEDWLMGNG